MMIISIAGLQAVPAAAIDGCGTVNLGAAMALILLSITPVFYLSCQKHIIKGVAAGAVKG